VEHFYVGLNNPSFAWAFSHSMLSINELRRRKRDFRVNRWILDSGAFTEISTHGRWRHDSDEYIELIHRWSTVGQLDAAVSQDMMCEPDILAKTGLSIAEHQENTIIRYNEISQWVDVYVMPVLQGYSPASYVDHVRQYGKLLKHGQWVGVGSVCKRNGNPDAIEDVLLAIKRERPDLRCTGSASKHQRLNDLPCGRCCTVPIQWRGRWQAANNGATLTIRVAQWRTSTTYTPSLNNPVLYRLNFINSQQRITKPKMKLTIASLFGRQWWSQRKREA